MDFLPQFGPCGIAYNYYGVRETRPGWYHVPSSIYCAVDHDTLRSIAFAIYGINCAEGVAYVKACNPEYSSTEPLLAGTSIYLRREGVPTNDDPITVEGVIISDSSALPAPTPAAIPNSGTLAITAPASSEGASANASAPTYGVPEGGA
jgi:hypothetical protein